MESWTLKALQRWPNVPAVFGWLSLNRRGQWLIKDEQISRRQIIDAINANYAADEYGRWYFQNGPQRGFMQLAYAPFVLHVDGEALITHTRQRIEHLSRVYLDEEGSLLLVTELGPGVLIDTDLDWAISRMSGARGSVQADDIAAALDLSSGQATELVFHWQGLKLPINRLDMAAQSAVLKFVRDPQPHPNEHASTGARD